MTVPTNANFLVVGVLDSYYGDNADYDGNLAVHLCLDSQSTITVDPTPEPATYALFLSGLGGLWALRRFRRAR